MIELPEKWYGYSPVAALEREYSLLFQIVSYYYGIIQGFSRQQMAVKEIIFIYCADN
ncbi:MAG: hypothetical protein GX878_10860 [Firmicutes bacterium]|nr:hypothetical protein [Bacillota bacterium]